MAKQTENLTEWTDQLLLAEEKMSETYEMLSSLQRELKQAGRKKDMQAIAEVTERLARYGRLFEDIRASWNDVE